VGGLCGPDYSESRTAEPGPLSENGLGINYVFCETVANLGSGYSVLGTEYSEEPFVVAVTGRVRLALHRYGGPRPPLFERRQLI